MIRLTRRGTPLKYPKISDAKMGKRVPKLQGNNAWNWKSNPTYGHLHRWIRRWWGRASKCEFCKKTSGFFEWANLDGKYSRERKDWKMSCRPCHHKLDGHNKKGWATKKSDPVYYAKLLKRMSLAQKRGE